MSADRIAEELMEWEKEEFVDETFTLHYMPKRRSSELVFDFDPRNNPEHFMMMWDRLKELGWNVTISNNHDGYFATITREDSCEIEMMPSDTPMEDLYIQVMDLLDLKKEIDMK